MRLSREHGSLQNSQGTLVLCSSAVLLVGSPASSEPAGALIFRLSDFLDILGLGIGDSKAICSAHESFLCWTKPEGLDVDRNEDVHEELHDESLRRTFVGFTHAAYVRMSK
jgi:hypothetical protein